MTTKQNPNVSMLDEDLDQVSGGLIAIIAIAASRRRAGKFHGNSPGERLGDIKGNLRATLGDINSIGYEPAGQMR